MLAGFGKVCITPPLDTAMCGFLDRDLARGCEAVHDDLFVRALYLEHDGRTALILGFDLLFFDRPQADRFRGTLSRQLNLPTQAILLNTSHTHAGPAVGAWASQGYIPPAADYLDKLEEVMLQAALQARDAARDVSLHTGVTRTALPLNRRRVNALGKVEWAPNPNAPVYDRLPFCLFLDGDERPVCLLFSVACHPSTINGYTISADYPGVAMTRLDAHLRADCSLFLQGAGGDSKPRVIGEGGQWRAGTWEDVRKAGLQVADELIAALGRELTPITPHLHTAEIEMVWPLLPPPDRITLAVIHDNPPTPLHRQWAEQMLARLDRDGQLPTAAPIRLHGMQIGQGLRLVGLEGEPVAELGMLIDAFYGDGITLPLGYTEGAQLYLPVSHMLPEGGYEVDSYYEYYSPAPLAAGMEAHLQQGLAQLYAAGIR